MTENLPQISLRRFRETVADIRHPVEVSRRSPGGFIEIIGRWQPYNTDVVDSMGEQTVTTRTVESPNINDGAKVLDLTTGPKVVRTPAEAATAVSPNPVRAVPKPSQRRKR